METDDDCVNLATVAYEALLWHFEHVEECSCSNDEYGTCWYRYTSDEKRQARIDHVARALEEARNEPDHSEIPTAQDTNIRVR